MRPRDPKSAVPPSIAGRGEQPPGGTTSRPLEDKRLQAVIAGDREAAGSLLTELLPRVRNLVRYLRHGDQDVDDIAQEALIAIVRGLPGWRGEGSFKSWADRVVARTTFAHLKKARALQGPTEGEPEALAEVASEEGTPEHYVFRRDMARLLDELPEEQRHTLVLHHVMGMSVPEMTEELGIPFETVRSRLRLGRHRLRELYERESSPAGSER